MKDTYLCSDLKGKKYRYAQDLIRSARRAKENGAEHTWVCEHRIDGAATQQYGEETSVGSGDNGGEDPPVPISNTEVKLPSAEDTWREAALENRTLPVLLKKFIFLL